MLLDPWFLGKLACPWDRRALTLEGSRLVCSCGKSFSVVRGVPVLLRDDVEHTHPSALRSLERAREGSVEGREPAAEGIDPFVQEIIAATNGVMYVPLVGKLRSYPIPTLRLPPRNGGLFLDIGCNWGRWCVAASRLGYTAVGVDPSLDALLAASRVAQQLGVSSRFVVGDARHLPFVAGTFDQAFSYSVLQHLSKEHVRAALAQISEVLRPNGGCLVQMPNVFGMRNLYNQARRGFRGTKDFDVRYWTPQELRETFGSLIGPTELAIDGFFSLNPQPAEAHLLPRRFRAVVRVSETLRAAGARAPGLLHLADSVYASARKQAPA